MEGNVKKTEEYANSITISNTFFDFVLDFKREFLYEFDGKQEKEIDNVARIRMSPQMAKAVSELLNQNVRTYEANFGEIAEFKPE